MQGSCLLSAAAAVPASPADTPPVRPSSSDSGRLSGAGMSRNGAAPSPGLGFYPVACRFLHNFVLCGIDMGTGLEPQELAGKAGLQ